MIEHYFFVWMSLIMKTSIPFLCDHVILQKLKCVKLKFFLSFYFQLAS